MPVTDPISDMLTRIRNAVMSHHETVKIPHSQMKRSLLRLMRDEGFISNVQTHRDGVKADFEVTLRYYDDNDESVITGLKRVSKPGRRNLRGQERDPALLRRPWSCIHVHIERRDDLGPGTTLRCRWRVVVLRLVI